MLNGNIGELAALGDRGRWHMEEIMKVLFLGLSAVFLLAAATPAGACHYGAGYRAAVGTHYYRPYRHYRGYHPYLRYRAARRVLR